MSFSKVDIDSFSREEIERYWDFLTAEQQYRASRRINEHASLIEKLADENYEQLVSTCESKMEDFYNEASTLANKACVEASLHLGRAVAAIAAYNKLIDVLLTVQENLSALPKQVELLKSIDPAMAEMLSMLLKDFKPVLQASSEALSDAHLKDVKVVEIPKSTSILQGISPPSRTLSKYWL